MAIKIRGDTHEGEPTDFLFNIKKKARILKKGKEIKGPYSSMFSDGKKTRGKISRRQNVYMDMKYSKGVEKKIPNPIRGHLGREVFSKTGNAKLENSWMAGKKAKGL